MKTKTKLAIVLSAIVISAVGFTAARANILPWTTGVLVNTVLNPFEAKLVIVDMTDADITTEYTLPSTTNRDGDMYIVKMIHAPSGLGVDVYPASGDTIEDSMNGPISISSGSNVGYATFVADDSNNTWWVINKGQFNY